MMVSKEDKRSRERRRKKRHNDARHRERREESKRNTIARSLFENVCSFEGEVPPLEQLIVDLGERHPEVMFFRNSRGQYNLALAKALEICLSASREKDRIAVAQQLANLANVKLRAGIELSSLALQIVISYGDTEEKKRDARQYLSRDRQALNFLLHAGLGPDDVVALGERTGEGVTQWAKKWRSRPKKTESDPLVEDQSDGDVSVDSGDADGFFDDGRNSRDTIHSESGEPHPQSGSPIKKPANEQRPILRKQPSADDDVQVSEPIDDAAQDEKDRVAELIRHLQAHGHSLTTEAQTGHTIVFLRVDLGRPDAWTKEPLQIFAAAVEAALQRVEKA